ncbi:MAG: site-2 protease family protein [Actinomycetaceae bacterium]|nr:site-2 protease family protein [Actinomycetaceae bacterium]
MGSLLGIAVVVVGLVISVAIHELGHMYFAKRYGVPVPEYAVGFGPILLKKTIGETQYSFRAIPLGGFVRILGMFAPAREGVRTTNRKGNPTLAEEARRQSAEEIEPWGEERAFYRLSVPKKIMVMFAGPLTNLILAVVLTVGTMMGIGHQQPTTTVRDAPETVTTEAGQVPGPAYAAGIRQGDRIVSVAGTPIDEWADIGTVLASTEGDVTVVVERGGETLNLTATPMVSEDARRLAIRSHLEYVPASPTQVVETLGNMAFGTAALVARLPMAVWDVVVTLFSDAERDPSGVVSVVGVGRLAGEITAEDSALGIEDPRAIWSVLLMLVASINMALFVFNLIPLPPLDGGHIMGALYEGGKRAFARLRQAPDPGPSDTARLMPLTYTVGATLLVMSVILIIADVIKPISLG